MTAETETGAGAGAGVDAQAQAHAHAQAQAYPFGITDSDLCKLQRLTAEAERRFPDGQWSLDITWWTTGRLQPEAFHTVDILTDGVVVREYLKLDGEGGFTQQQVVHHQARSYAVRAGDELPITGEVSCGDE